MSRTQLFFRGFSIMMRSGPMWLVALTAAAVNLLGGLLLGRLLPSGGILGSLLSTLLGALTGAFLTGTLILLANDAAGGHFATFGEGFAAGARFFPVLLVVDLVLAVPTFLSLQLDDLFISGMQPALTAASPELPVSLLLMALCGLPLLLLAMMLAASIILGAERSVALEGAGAWSALKHGWRLLAQKIGDMFVIGLIELGIIIVASVFFGCAGFFLAISAHLVDFTSTTSVANFAGNTTFTMVMALVMIPFQIWFSVVWTLAFSRWQGKDLVQIQRAVIPPANFPPGV